MALEYTFFGLQNLGIFDVILPFILVFAVVFAILQKAKIFGDGSKRFNVVIALVMGLAVVFPHVLWGVPDPTVPVLSNGMPDIVNIMNHALPNVSIVVIAILMALIIIGVMGRRFELGNSSLSGWIAFIAFAIVLYIFGSAAEWWSTPMWQVWFLGNPDLLALVIVILMFAIIIWFITKEDKKDDGFFEKFGKGLGELLQKDK